MNPIEEIKKLLIDYPDLHFEESSTTFIVYPNDANGFKVSLKVWKSGLVLSFGRWHEYFPANDKSAKVAAVLFKFGLSDSCKLKVYRKGNMEYKCELNPTNGQLRQVSQYRFIHIGKKIKLDISRTRSSPVTSFLIYSIQMILKR